MNDNKETFKDYIINEYKKSIEPIELGTDQIITEMVTDLKKENKKFREFIEDCANSHNETRFKYKAKAILTSEVWG